MGENLELLKEIGLTESESKVYVALLKIGGFTSKKLILQESGIAPSKVYHVLEKLMKKGLVSKIIKDNVQNFSAASPRRVMDYIGVKKDKLLQQEKIASEIIPTLDGLYKTFRQKTTAEIFFGWKGMETVYSSLIHDLSKGDEIRVLGANKGHDPEKTARFFSKYGSLARKKGISIRIIFDESSREYNEQIEKDVKFKFNKKFLSKISPVETLIAKSITAIVILRDEPMVIFVKDNETAESFCSYFDELWKIAK